MGQMFFFSGTRLVFVDLLCVVPWCRGCKCGRGGRPVVCARVRLSSFCEVILVSLRFICLSMMCFFFAEAVPEMVSPRTIGCVILTPLSGSEAL